MLTSTKSSFVSFRRWNEKLSAGLKAYKAGAFEKAVQSFGEALEIAAQLRISEEFIRTSLFYGLALRNANQVRKAEDIFVRAITYSDATGFENTEEHMFILAELGLLALEAQDHSRAANYLERSVEIQIQRNYSINAEFFTFYFALLLCHALAEDWHKASELSHFAYKWSEKHLGARDEITLISMTWRLLAAAETGHLEEAERLNSHLKATICKEQKCVSAAGLQMIEWILGYRKERVTEPSLAHPIAIIETSTRGGRTAESLIHGDTPG